VLSSVREQCHKASLFDCRTQTALVLGASAGFATRLDLPAIRNEAFHKAGGIFIVDFAYMVMTKLTCFAA